MSTSTIIAVSVICGVKIGMAICEIAKNIAEKKERKEIEDRKKHKL